MQLTRMPLRTASAVTFFYALGYPIGNLAVGAMTPMAVLVFRFSLAGLLLGAWAAISRVPWPRGRKLAHVAVTGLLMQAVQFCCLYLAVQRGAPAVLCAVVIAMNPVATAVLGALFLRERLGPARILALGLGVAAVLAACASRLVHEHGVDPVFVLLLVALLGLAAGGVYQQRFCADVDFRASVAVQNTVALIPAAVLATLTPFAIHDHLKAGLAVAAVVLLNAGVGVSLYVRAINRHGAAAVAMLFCLIPAVAGVLSWLMLGEHPDIGIGVGLVLGAFACWLNARASRQKRQDDPGRDGRGQNRVETVHDPAVAG
ncbi:DMT family transporter [Mycolicibacterium komossense]|uniref:DMT family transporter n=1 Tax=Mycolicibacterium komossense TaxID=1779 RepID=A0ABT3CGZ0_9MYCO|nr:DMT family transporter [Mycolicibacterium komossense]MCV7228701.1 DMT family transporter [Mycolicibacterium komossense]